MRSIALPSSSSSALLLRSSQSQSQSRYFSTTKISCSSLRSHVYIPKLEPFNNRSKIERGVKEPSFIEKSETELLDYCSVLEGDDSFNCWTAYFELKDLERKLSKDEIEKLIHETEGVKSLIECVHGVSSIYKTKNEEKNESLKPVEKKHVEEHFPIPDGLPKSEKEIEEEEKGRMPDSPFTRLLRTKGKFPAWFSQAPDHETD
ncbi:Ccg-binding protein 1-like [Thalictrum thalictroides]|uniref:Ccg-binding protein 1-like n=1 Tax=Thalictrum thalictroides TaxID=46969 RepID=A0A7J6WI07_THATH|nr:Ccg-binding protein 1-like [Thalictrum thalictroides]